MLLRHGRKVVFCGAIILITATYLIASNFDYRSGDLLMVQNKILNFGKVESSSKLNACFYLQNTSQIPVQIVGIQTSCDCLTTSLRPPFELAGGETRAIPFRMEFPDQPEELEREMIFYTNKPQQRRLSASVVADVQEPARRD